MKIINKLIVTSVLLSLMFVLAYVGIKPQIAKADFGDIIMLSQTGNVAVTINNASSGPMLDSLIGLQSPNRIVIGHSKTNIGTTVNLGQFSSGTELVFFITTPENNTFFTGPASRNPDNLVHARITGGGSYGNIQQWQVSFEDLLNATNTNFGDVVFNVVATLDTNNINTSCTYHSYQGCLGNNLYWYNSCGQQQDLAQYCSNGCYNNSCGNNYNNYNNCTYHAYKGCVGNSIYWYNSCGQQQDLVYGCTNGQTCQYGQCTAYVQPVPVYNNYTAHYRKACYGNSIHWYDSLGVESGLYKSCIDVNSCTTDTCSAGSCSNTIKCDGSTCATGSADYNTYCVATPAVPNPQPNTATGLPTLFSAKQSVSSQWQKTVEVRPNGQVYFMISVVNNSLTKADNVIVSANIPSEISYLGNLQLDGVTISGDIVSGVDIGSIASANTKSITFEGRTQAISTTATKQATVTSNNSGATQSDSISINFVSDQAAAAAAVSKSETTTGFLGFLKHWYLWILVGLILVFLFIVVYKRFSSDV